MFDAIRFTRPFLDTLTEDELAIIQFIYHRHTNRVIDLRCVKVVPLFEMILATDSLTQEGMRVMSSAFLKIAEEYQLPTWGLNQFNIEGFVSGNMPAISGVVDITAKNIAAPIETL